MAKKSKREIVEAITALLSELVMQEERDVGRQDSKPESEQLEMLTVKECVGEVKGLTENTVRQLIRQNKLPHIRCGRGERGKILVKRSDLIKCINDILLE